MMGKNDTVTDLIELDKPAAVAKDDDDFWGSFGTGSKKDKKKKDGDAEKTLHPDTIEEPAAEDDIWGFGASSKKKKKGTSGKGPVEVEESTVASVKPDSVEETKDDLGGADVYVFWAAWGCGSLMMMMAAASSKSTSLMEAAAEPPPPA